MPNGWSAVAAERRRKSRFLAGVGAALLVLVALRLFYLQVLHDDEYRRLATSNYLRPEVITAMRGMIRDRHGTILASSEPSFTASIDPWHEAFRPGPHGMKPRARLDEVVARLADILEMDPRALLEAVERQKKASYQPVRIRRNLEAATMSRLAEHRVDLPGVVVEMEPLRRYPFGEVGAHLLGYINEITDEELVKLRGQGYLPGDYVGRAGLERYHETSLRGQDGFRFVEVNALGRRTNYFSSTPPVVPKKGRDLVLTIDWKLQQAAEAALDSAGWAGHGVPPEARGAVVAIDPRNGDVLALASRPAFDPNEFAAGLSPERWAELNEEGRFAMLNRAVQARYPPGSTFKPVTLLAGLTGHKVGTGTVLHGCAGGYTFGGRFFRCWNKNGHGSSNGVRALEVSCDVYFYQLGLMLGIDGIAGMARRFRLDEPTGIDLPQERGGLIPDVAWYEKKRGKGGAAKGSALNLAIGQGEILMTPVEIAQMAGTVATGRIPRLHLVKEMSDEPGFEHFVPDTTARGALAAPAGMLEYVRRGMWEVVQGVEGTGKRAKIDSVEVAGKTGSAQNAADLTHALFIGFAPYERPEIAVAVVLEARGGGGAFAAPVARAVLDHYFHPEHYIPRPDSAAVADSLLAAGVPPDSLEALVRRLAGLGPEKRPSRAAALRPRTPQADSAAAAIDSLAGD